jgi:hypothetical protein
MWASSQELDAEARQRAKDKAEGVTRIGLSPAAALRRLEKKKAEARAAKKAGNV